MHPFSWDSSPLSEECTGEPSWANDAQERYLFARLLEDNAVIVGGKATWFLRVCYDINYWSARQLKMAAFVFIFLRADIFLSSAATLFANRPSSTFSADTDLWSFSRFSRNRNWSVTFAFLLLPRLLEDNFSALGKGSYAIHLHRRCDGKWQPWRCRTTRRSLHHVCDKSAK